VGQYSEECRAMLEDAVIFAARNI